MTTETTTAPKGPANAIPLAKHGCCGGEAAPESRNDASERADHDHHAHATPSKPAQSSCCCGANKDSRVDDSKSRNVVSKCE